MPRFLILALAAVSLLGFAACGDDDDDGGETPSPSPTVESSSTPFPNVCLANPDPATVDFQVLDQPESSSEVTSPVVVSGQVNYFEATYQIAIYDENGAPLVETFGTAQQPDVGVIGPFSHRVAFSVSEPTPACLWVYEQSAQDGSPVNVGQVPIVLLP